MNTTNNPIQNLKVHDATWFGLLQYKMTKFNTLSELIEWGNRLILNNPNLPVNLKNFLSEVEILSRNKNQFPSYPFPHAKTDVGEYLYMRDDLFINIHTFMPHDTDNILRQKYINQFIHSIPGFQEEWESDVEFRQGNDSVYMLFVFLDCSLPDYDANTLLNIFKSKGVKIHH